MKKTTSKRFPLTEEFRNQALYWAAAFPFCSYLTSNQIPYPHDSFKEMLAVGSNRVWELGDDPFDPLFQLHKDRKNWLFGYFTYELKNSIHNLKSNKSPLIPFPSCTFFEPDTILFFHDQEVEIQSMDLMPEQVYRQIIQKTNPLPKKIKAPVQLKQHISRREYIQKVEVIRQHILEGDCYELNLCQEFSASGLQVEPISLFHQLNSLSPAPFAAFLRIRDQYLLCASPERFLKKEGDLLVSQPIKGTTRRGKSADEDEQLKELLRNDEKEMAENMMIVDLVRNDLARSSSPGSVKVDEMFGIYSFRHVHQMISTVSGRLRPEVPFTEAIKNAFPMGSMTGAPKRKVMELIEQYENSARGLYSGSVGYITPEGNFDFNVIIRSMLYSPHKGTASFQVGGAITYDSIPEKEYEECLLKASALLEVLGADTTTPF